MPDADDDHVTTFYVIKCSVDALHQQDSGAFSQLGLGPSEFRKDLEDSDALLNRAKGPISRGGTLKSDIFPNVAHILQGRFAIDDNP